MLASGHLAGSIYEKKRAHLLYRDAVQRLNLLRTNFDSRKASKALADKSQLLQQMIGWCEAIGYKPVDFDCLNAIHIAGSKGKGSTAAFVYSILSEYLKDDQPVTTSGISRLGLYTSPHLRTIRERIHLRTSKTSSFSDTMINKDDFALRFCEVWDRLGLEYRRVSDSPPFAKFLTLVAFHTFVQGKVDTAIVEVCLGGRYDSTNVIQKPSVCAITSLELEHTDILGSTIEEIALSKGGIIKPGCPVFTAPQQPKAMAILEMLAEEVEAELTTVSVHRDVHDLELGLAGHFQRINASLAVAVAASHLRRMGYADVPEHEVLMRSPLPDKFRRGLSNAIWPGRCETRDVLGARWLLDGAHTIESITLLGPWVAEKFHERRNSRRVLVFNKQTQDAFLLLQHLLDVMVAATSNWLVSGEPLFHQVVFCTNLPWERCSLPDIERVSMTYSGGLDENQDLQKQLASFWNELGGASSKVSVSRTVEEAVRCATCLPSVRSERNNDEDLNRIVLVTGSLHLVGSALEVLDSVLNE